MPPPPTDGGTPPPPMDGGTPTPPAEQVDLVRVPFSGQVYEVDLDAQGNTFVRLQYRAPASFQGAALPDDGTGRLQNAVARLDGALRVQWVTALPSQEAPSGSASRDALELHMAVHPDGAVALAGTFTGTLVTPVGTLVGRPAPDASGFVARLGPDGAWQWARALTSDRFLRVADVAAGAGGMAVAGTFAGTSAELGRATSAGVEFQGWAARLDAAGAVQGVHTFTGTTRGFGFGVALGPTGELLVTGATQGGTAGGGQRITPYIVRLDAGGALTWEKRFGDFSGQAHEVAVSPLGAVAVHLRLDTSRPVRWGPVTLGPSGARAALVVAGPGGDERWARELGRLVKVGLGWDAREWLTVTGKDARPTDLGGGPVGERGRNNLFVARLQGDGAHVWSTALPLNDPRPYGLYEPFEVALLPDGGGRIAGYDDLVLIQPR